jgi:hypothetical protein
MDNRKAYIEQKRRGEGHVKKMRLILLSALNSHSGRMLTSIAYRRFPVGYKFLIMILMTVWAATID